MRVVFAQPQDLLDVRHVDGKLWHYICANERQVIDEDGRPGWEYDYNEIVMPDTKTELSNAIQANPTAYLDYTPQQPAKIDIQDMHSRMCAIEAMVTAYQVPTEALRILGIDVTSDEVRALNALGVETTSA